MLPPSAELLQGREAIEAFWKAGLEAGASELERVSLELEQHDGLAYEIGRYELRLKPAEGGTVVDRGKYVLVHQRQADGSWRWAVEMFNPDAPPETTGGRPEGGREEAMSGTQSTSQVSKRGEHMSMFAPAKEAAGRPSLKVLIALCASVAAAFAAPLAAQAITINFTTPCSAENWPVPAGVTSITVEAFGAQCGGSGGGLGGSATATLAVTPLEMLQVNVGGQSSPCRPATGWCESRTAPPPRSPSAR